MYYTSYCIKSSLLSSFPATFCVGDPPDLSQVTNRLEGRYDEDPTFIHCLPGYVDVVSGQLSYPIICLETGYWDNIRNCTRRLPFSFKEKLTL